MKTAIGLLGLCCVMDVGAHPYFTGNPYTPIPPSCITEAHPMPLLSAALNGVSAVVWEGQIDLVREDSQQTFVPNNFPLTSAANLSIYRVACSEPDRSALIADFRVRWTAPPTISWSRYMLPRLDLDTNGWGGNSFELASETGDWHPGAEEVGIGDFTQGSGYDGIDWFSWTYVLDVFEPQWEGYTPITAETYNSNFTLGTGSSYLNMPPLGVLLDQAPALPLNGRLSGTWVVEGARDQGLILSFSSRVPPAGQLDEYPEVSPMLLFLSWYTFDLEGRMLWLTGSAEVAQGATEVDVPIVLTGGGEFLGGSRANRAHAGQVRLSSLSCNDLRLDYDLKELSLGAGSGQLRRMHALEVAGYNCRDYEARQQTLTDDHLQRRP